MHATTLSTFRGRSAELECIEVLEIQARIGTEHLLIIEQKIRVKRERERVEIVHSSSTLALAYSYSYSHISTHITDR